MIQLTSQAVESQQNDAIETVPDNVDVALEHEQPHLALSWLALNQYLPFEIEPVSLWHNDAQTHALHVDLKNEFHVWLGVH